MNDQKEEERVRCTNPTTPVFNAAKAVVAVTEQAIMRLLFRKCLN